MKSTTTQLAKKVDSGKMWSDSETESIRGLESFTKATAKRRQDMKMDGWNAVLVEQERHITPDSQQIAQEYFEWTTKSREDAVGRGQKDAMAVKRIIQQDNCYKEWIGMYGKTLDDSLNSNSSERTRGRRQGLKKILRWTRNFSL